MALGDPDLTADVLAIFCCVFAEYGDAKRTATLLGAMEALERQAELPISEPDATVLARSLDKVRPEPPSDGWLQDVDRGSRHSVQNALAGALAVRPPSTCAGQAHSLVPPRAWTVPGSYRLRRKVNQHEPMVRDFTGPVLSR